MTKVPPLLPDETLARVHRIARLDGLSILVLSSIFAVLAGMSHDYTGALVGLLVAGAGAVELHGAGLLRDGQDRGMGWLVASQLFLLVSILAYCALRLMHRDMPPLPEEMRPMVEASAGQIGLTVERYLEVLNSIYRFTLWLVAGVSVLYQGGMALYYFRRREIVTRALAVE